MKMCSSIRQIVLLIGVSAILFSAIASGLIFYFAQEVSLFYTLFLFVPTAFAINLFIVIYLYRVVVKYLSSQIAQLCETIDEQTFLSPGDLHAKVSFEFIPIYNSLYHSFRSLKEIQSQMNPKLKTPPALRKPTQNPLKDKKQKELTML